MLFWRVILFAFQNSGATPQPSAPWYSDPLVGLGLTVVAMIPGYIFLILPWVRKGRNGHRELRRIYQSAVEKVGGKSKLRLVALSIIKDAYFFLDFMLPNSVSRESEFKEFQRRLQHDLPNVPLHDIKSFLNQLFDEIFDGLQYAEYAAWQKKYEDWRGELNSITIAPLPDGRREHRFIFLSLFASKPNMEQAEHGALQYFQGQPVPILRLAGDELAIATSDCETSKDIWESLLTNSLRVIRQADRDQKQVHLILHTVSVWNLALGILLNNRIPITLYHWQQQYYRLWTIDRSAKDLRSPKINSSSLALLSVDFEDVAEGAVSEPAEALVIQIGANHAANAVREWMTKHARCMPLRIVSKKAGRLDPQKPEDWIQCAAEIAELIDLIKAKNIYFFADMPAVLALMVGDALGSYRSNIHLMQFLNGAPEREYKEVLVITKELITRIDGNAC